MPLSLGFRTVVFQTWCHFGSLHLMAQMCFYVNKSHGSGHFEGVFPLIDLGQWWSIVPP